MDKIMEIDGAYEVVLGLGGFAAFLGVLSLFLRYRKMETPLARRICFASDLLNTTFVSITVVGVLTVSFQVAIYVPRDLNETKTEILADLSEVKALMPREVDVSDLAKERHIAQLEDRINQLTEHLSKADLRSVVDALIAADNFNENSLEQAVRDSLGNWNGETFLEIDSNHPEAWRCHSDAPYLVCAFQ